MPWDFTRATALAVAIGLVCAAGTAAHAETPPSGGRLRVDRSTVDGGGERSQGGAWVLIGTIGQPDAARSSAGAYALSGGFWAASASPSAPPGDDALFSNGFE